MNASVVEAKMIYRKACINLLQQLYPYLSPEELEGKFFWGEEQAYVLWTDRKIVGVAVWEEYDYFPDGSCLLELAAIIIDKYYRRQGFGRKLYEDSIFLVSKTLDIAGIHVLTTKDALGFYEKMPSSKRVYTEPIQIRGIWYVSLLCEI